MARRSGNPECDPINEIICYFVACFLYASGETLAEILEDALGNVWRNSGETLGRPWATEWHAGLGTQVNGMGTHVLGADLFIKKNRFAFIKIQNAQGWDRTHDL